MYCNITLQCNIIYSRIQHTYIDILWYKIKYDVIHTYIMLFIYVLYMISICMIYKLKK
jgi:hypothetical protein